MAENRRNQVPNILLNPQRPEDHVEERDDRYPMGQAVYIFLMYLMAVLTKLIFECMLEKILEKDGSQPSGLSYACFFNMPLLFSPIAKIFGEQHGIRCHLVTGLLITVLGTSIGLGGILTKNLIFSLGSVILSTGLSLLYTGGIHILNVVFVAARFHVTARRRE